MAVPVNSIEFTDSNRLAIMADRTRAARATWRQHAGVGLVGWASKGRKGRQSHRAHSLSLSRPLSASPSPPRVSQALCHRCRTSAELAHCHHHTVFCHISPTARPSPPPPHRPPIALT